MDQPTNPKQLSITSITITQPASIEKAKDTPFLSTKLILAELYITDRLNAVLMTYAVLAENLYFNSLANGNTNKGSSDSGGAEWFKSGVADFVHGGDFLLEFSGFSQSTIDSFGSGDSQASTLEQRASYYAAVRFLHHELKNAGFSDGDIVKNEMLGWMSEKVK